LVEHVRGTGAACAQFNIRAPKATETGDVLGVLKKLAGRGPPNVRVSASGPDWLHDPAAYVAACAIESELYEEIDRLGAQLSDARERSKADLLIHLSGKHPVVLAFDSRLITLGDLERRLYEAGDHAVVLPPGPTQLAGGRCGRQRHAARSPGD
jgi:hypothetical protein